MINELINKTNEIFGTVRISDGLKYKRRPKVTSLKYVFHYLHKVEGMKQKEIARAFNRDSSTVNRAIKKVKDNPLINGN